MTEARRALPSVDELVRRAGQGYPHALAVSEARRIVERARAQGATGDLEAELREALGRWRRPSLRRVINATGVVLHTNLGRAPLPEYSNLEYDLATGRRGRRDSHTAPLLEYLTGRRAIAVNNGAAAVYLVLHELAADGGEVIISRGEMIEIGDGFRIPDIMVHAGARLVEVGTTNRTRLEDYRRALTERTRLLLRVHRSNFRIEGFTGRPTLRELASLGVPVYEDLGSGCAVDFIDEPGIRQSFRDGADLVSFSGDKLLGGPQAGIIAGRDDLVERVRRNPMFRALRLDKLQVEALESTLRRLALEEYDEIPALRMARMSVDEIRRRAEALLAACPELKAEIVAGESVLGGGSTPEKTLPTVLIRLRGDARALEARLRLGDPPVIARIEDGAVVLDLRTVAGVGELAARLRELAGG